MSELIMNDFLTKHVNARANDIYNLIFKKSKKNSDILISRTEKDNFTILVVDSIEGMVPVWNSFEIFKVKEEDQIKKYLVEKLSTTGIKTFHVSRVTKPSHIASDIQITQEWENLYDRKIL